MPANNDGKISREEWIARYGSDAGFDEYDLDGDGIIDGPPLHKSDSMNESVCQLASSASARPPRLSMSHFRLLWLVS